MDSWMNDERRDITRKGTNYHNEYNPPYMMINSPDLQHLLVKSCYDDKYTVKYGEASLPRETTSWEAEGFPGRCTSPPSSSPQYGEVGGLAELHFLMRISMISMVIV